MKSSKFQVGDRIFFRAGPIYTGTVVKLHSSRSDYYIKWDALESVATYMEKEIGLLKSAIDKLDAIL